MKKNKFTEEIDKVRMTDGEKERVYNGAKTETRTSTRSSLLRTAAVAVALVVLITACAVCLPLLSKDGEPAETGETGKDVPIVNIRPDFSDIAGIDGVITGSVGEGPGKVYADGSRKGSITGSIAEGYPAPAADGAVGAPEVVAPSEGAISPADPELPIGSDTPDTNGIEYQAGILTAGRWCDNDNYDFYLGVLKRDEWKAVGTTWKLFPTSRYAVNVPGAKGAYVALADGQNGIIYTAVTDNNGDAYLYYNTSSAQDNQKPAKILVDTGTSTAVYTLTGEEKGVITVECASENKPLKLDLMLMIDTTGSMGDEMEYLKAELKDVITRVKRDNGNLEIRVSVNFYRDTTDEYVVKYFDFDTDVDKWVDLLGKEYASGGGDMPEAVDEALDNAVNGHKWDEDAVKLMFFVLDAPPHSDRQGSIESISNSIVSAAKKGIRILPIASSGVDTETEYLLRAMSAMTGGVYTFLTDHSGVGDSHLEASVGQFEVEALNNLMVSLISDYLK